MRILINNPRRTPVAGQTIIVTGASAGIGRATARKFLQEGWRVGLIGRRTEALVETAAGNENALVLTCDVTDPQQVEAAFDQAMAQWGRLDALFNNAGRGLKSVLPDDVSIEQWQAVIDVNINAVFYCARAAFARMRRQDPQGGRIINNGSISAHVPRPGSIAYTASKHAVTGMTRTLGLDGRPFGIACGQIDIGNARTDLASKQEKGVPQADGSIRAEAMMDVDHVASSVYHMANLPLDVNIPFLTVMATTMPFIGRG
ncbi:SDR family oxidoreductase [Candidimonas nitroreducens]|uniref:3-oxoacyl-ACP reductase n=1 Tax=Candidimonas nitroreducens TaxID=683354 RepID=A0A225ML10_9BURK|nr:SDR family oxidoreductase [Candidimonas nitroreducens]OWT62057.1 3-oxoacyl-ACP reductase [Candidimonas nitroreducens]